MHPEFLLEFQLNLNLQQLDVENFVLGVPHVTPAAPPRQHHLSIPTTTAHTNNRRRFSLPAQNIMNELKTTKTNTFQRNSVIQLNPAYLTQSGESSSVSPSSSQGKPFLSFQAFLSSVNIFTKLVRGP